MFDRLCPTFCGQESRNSCGPWRLIPAALAFDSSCAGLTRASTPTQSLPRKRGRDWVGEMDCQVNPRIKSGDGNDEITVGFSCGWYHIVAVRYGRKAVTFGKSGQFRCEAARRQEISRAATAKFGAMQQMPVAAAWQGCRRAAGLQSRYFM